MLFQSRSKWLLQLIWCNLNGNKIFQSVLFNSSHRFNSLFVPSGVVYEIFDLFILGDAAFQCFCLVQQWTVETENLFSWIQSKKKENPRKLIQRNRFNKQKRKKTKTERKKLLTVCEFWLWRHFSCYCCCFLCDFYT